MFKHYSMLAVQASLHDPTARCAAAAALRSRPFPRALSEEISRSEFSTGDRELGRPELTPLGKCSGAVELEIVP